MMLMEKSVCDIFHTMNWSDEIPCNTEAEEWLQRYSKGNIFSEHLFCEIDSAPEIMPSMWKSKVYSILALLQSKREFLTQVLNETAYNLIDSKKIVTTLCDDFKYYIEAAEDCTFSACELEDVYVNVGCKDVYIFGRILAPLLITGCKIKILPKDIEFIPYLVAIGEIISTNEIPKGSKYGFITSSDETEDAKWLVIKGDSYENFCPMVIDEKSDLDSAVENLLESSCSFKGKLYWSVTHAYIQESIFDYVISKLSDASKRLRNIDKVMFITCDQRKQLEESKDKRGLVCKLFVGWDPQELEVDYYLPMSVSLLPYRTIDEVVSLVNSKNSGYASSVWTDELSTANQLSKLLNMDTIWINSHGVINPLVPVQSSTASYKLPLNGMQLLEYLEIVSRLRPRLGIKLIDGINSAENKKPSLNFRKSLEEAIDSSKKGYEMLKKLNNENLSKLLNSIYPERIGHKRLLDVISRSDTVYRPSLKMDILCYSVPYKTIMIVFSSQVITEYDFKEVLWQIIAMRNSVIICAAPSLLTSIADTLSDSILNESVNLLDIKEYSPHNLNRIGQIIYVSDKINNYACNTHPQYMPSSTFSHFLTKKVVWIPNI